VDPQSKFFDDLPKIFRMIFVFHALVGFPTQVFFALDGRNATSVEVPVLSKSSQDHILLYLSVSSRAVIGQFSRPYCPVRPAKI